MLVVSGWLWSADGDLRGDCGQQAGKRRLIQPSNLVTPDPTTEHFQRRCGFARTVPLWRFLYHPWPSQPMVMAVSNLSEKTARKGLSIVTLRQDNLYGFLLDPAK